MALKIRLRRMGRKDAPTYRIVVAESSMPRDGRFVASIGHYNPRTEPMTLVVDRAQALQWMEKGAMPTDTARSLLKRAGVFKPEAESPIEAAVETVKKAAGKVVEAVKDAAEEIRDRVAGEEEPKAEAEAPAAEETEAAAEEEKPAPEAQEG